MIRITRKTAVAAPASLKVDGERHLEFMKVLYDAGVREFIFYPEVYGNMEVKNTLIKAQNYKCCFCESKIGHIDDGDVEHFRPKGASQQEPETPFLPGYYWLAYDWDNLFLACTKCNQRIKGNLFPLSNPGSRAASHHDDIAVEQPLFIHFSAEDPEDYITFTGEHIHAKNGSHRGSENIRLLKLDRTELTQARKEMLDMVDIVHLLTTILAQHLPADKAKEARDLYEALRRRNTDEHHQYSGMFRAFFMRYPLH